jgi:lipoate-protein ligase B
MDFKIPRKKKVKALEKTNFNTYLPKSPYIYTIYKLKIYTNNKKRNKDHRELLTLRRSLSGLVKRGQITYHGHNCLVAGNIVYLKNFFNFRKEKLIFVNHKEWRKLARIYYQIKQLSL